MGVESAVNKTTPIRRGLSSEGAKVTYIFYLMHTTHVLDRDNSTICVQALSMAAGPIQERNQGKNLAL